MNRALSACLLFAMFPLLSSAPPSSRADDVAKVSLKVGDKAPDFTLLSDKWKPVKLRRRRLPRQEEMSSLPSMSSPSPVVERSQLQAVQSGIKDGKDLILSDTEALRRKEALIRPLPTLLSRSRSASSFPS